MRTKTTLLGEGFEVGIAGAGFPDILLNDCGCFDARKQKAVDSTVYPSLMQFFVLFLHLGVCSLCD